MKTGLKKKSKLRLWIQIFFYAFIGIIAVNKGLVEMGGGIPFISEASLHALCPFGGVVTLYNTFTLGTFISKIHASSVILMVLVFILTALFGPVFCGWVCPMGTIQEWIGKIGKKIFKKRYNQFVPKRLDHALRYLRYVVLILVIVITAKSGYLMFAEVDPYNALFTFWYEDVSVKALIILAVTLVLSLFVERPWCKYACPYGGLLGLFNKIRFFKIKRNTNTCISCSKCDQNCPMNIEVSKKGNVTDLSCISCLECTSEAACPIEDTVTLQMGSFSSDKKQEDIS